MNDFVPLKMAAIPEALAHLPRAGGIIIPFVAPAHGTAKERIAHTNIERVGLCAKQRRCMLCGGHIGRRDLLAFVGDGSPRVGDCFGDPWFHVICAEYTVQACPWMAGRRNEIRKKATDGPADKFAAHWVDDMEKRFRLVIAKRASVHRDAAGHWHFEPHDVVEIRNLR